MFTKKLEDQFSADLLNTVNGILGEAKKCSKDCKCEKCEKEDEKGEKEEKDEMKEANLTGLPKSTAEKNQQYIEITHQLGHKRRVPVHPTNAYKALNRYRKDPSTKSARIVSEDLEQIDEISAELAARAGDKADERTRALANKRKRGVNPSALENKFRKQTRKFDNYADKKQGYTTEEAEQIDELSKKTLGSYVYKAANQVGEKGITAGLKIGDAEDSKKEFKTMGKRQKGIAKAVSKLTKEEQDFIDSLNNDTLEEGRGRPPKEGSPAWHAKQKQANDDMVALGMQLRKAKSMNKKVRFMDNKEHEVSAHHADRFEDHMAARKTSQEKAAFQKQAHKSHAEFVKAVTAPVPKASKDTGEIVKYRH